MRLGGPIFTDGGDPERWAAAVRESGYSAAYCPDVTEDSGAGAEDYAAAARRHGIVIAEVGAWSNPIDRDEDKRKEAISWCQRRLELAERIGARCCVNIAGSRGPKWDGPHEDNVSEDTFALIVDTVRDIIDSVKPKRTFYTLETMPWVFPDSADSYLRLIEAIDRKAFAAHLDPVNLINSPPRYFANGELIRDCFAKLGPYIKSCHAKDIVLSDRLTVHLDETRPGLGRLDYAVYLRELSKLDPDTPLMLEHLSEREEYEQAARHIRGVADRTGVSLC